MLPVVLKSPMKKIDFKFVLNKIKIIGNAPSHLKLTKILPKPPLKTATEIAIAQNH